MTACVTPQTFVEQDPFSQIENALWSALEKHKGFTDLVKVGNRLKMDRGFPNKPEAMVADMPEVRIEPAPSLEQYNITPNPRSSMGGVVPFALQVTTQDMRPSKMAYPVKWQIIKALTRAGVNLDDLPFVIDVNINGVADSNIDQEANRGTRGWRTLYLIAVRISIGVREMIEDDENP